MRTIFPLGRDFFSMMHMRLLSGRNFNSADFAEAEAAEERERAREAVQKAKEAGLPASSGNAAVPESAAKEAPVPVIVNKTFVQKYFPKVNPLGIHFRAHRGRPGKRGLGNSGLGDFRVVSDASIKTCGCPITLRCTFRPAAAIRFRSTTKMNPTAVTAFPSA